MRGFLIKKFSPKQLANLFQYARIYHRNIKTISKNLGQIPLFSKSLWDFSFAIIKPEGGVANGLFIRNFDGLINPYVDIYAILQLLLQSQ